MLRAEFSLPSVTSEESAPERKAPIRVKFEIPYFTVSGIQVSPKINDNICILYNLQLLQTRYNCTATVITIFIKYSIEEYLFFSR